MGQKHKRLKFVKKKDLISELPDGILSNIISLLTLKEAVRTSILSKSWVSLWTTHMDIVCTSTSILHDEDTDASCISRQHVRDTFIERMNHMMYQRCKGTKMNSIVIKYPLLQGDESHLTRWMSSALTMGAEKINLDLCAFYDYDEVDDHVSEQYTFPLSLLASPGKACTVKHLRLGSCGLSSLSISNSLASLATIELRNMNFTDEDLDVILCNCLSLERMVLNGCPDFVNFKLTNRRSRLKFLAFKCCCRLENIEIHANNLEILEYTGQVGYFLFNHVPKLAKVFLCFFGTSQLEGATYALSRIAYDLPRLETLNIVSMKVISALQLPQGKVSTFINIKQLVLSVCPFADDDKLHWITYILKAYPFLNKLQLNQFTPNFVKKSAATHRQLSAVTHKNLRELEITGYHGNPHEFELLKYLVYSAVKLDLLVIYPREKVYTGLSDWHCDQWNNFYNKLSSEKIEQLHAVVPEGVRLICCN